MKYFKINGKDFTRYFVPFNLYMVAYEPLYGSNAGHTLDGTEYTDEIKLNAIITVPCMPLTEEQAKTLLGEVYKNEYVELEYYDPRVGDYRKISATRAVSQAKHLGELVGGNYWTGITVTFKERGGNGGG